MALKIGGGAKPAYKGTAYEQTSVNKQDPEVEQVPVGGDLLPALGQQLAEPSLSMGVTLNTGNFTSVRVDVGIRIPCDPENIDATYDEMKAWADERINAVIEEVKSTYGTING